MAMNADNRCKLFIGGLDHSTTTPKLSYFFQKWGNVVDANVMVNPHTMVSRGFGFVRYSTPQMVDEAMKHRPHIIDGRSVETKRPMPRELTSADNNMSCYCLLVRSSTVDTQAAINEVSVRSYFGNFGNVVNVTAPQNPSGDFVVEFDDYDPVDKAILHGVHQLNGQTLVINKDTSAPSPQPSVNTLTKPELLECKLFVGGLDHFTTDTSLADHFKKFGEVMSTQVMYDPVTSRSRGYGFVLFATASSAEKALSESPHIVDSRTVDVKRFATREQIVKNPQASKKSDVSNKCRLFVGGLSVAVDDEALRSYFGEYGEVVTGTVSKDPSTKRSRGFAFLTFSEPEAVDRVMAARPHSLSNKSVEVKRPMPRELATPENTITVTKLFVGAVRDGTTEDQMRHHFAQFGNIVDLCLPLDRSTGRLRGFAFVEYDDYDAADKAMVSGSHEVNSRTLDVKKALPKEMARLAAASAPRQAPMGYPPQQGGMGYGGQHDSGYGGYHGGHGGGGGMGDYGAPAGGYGAPPSGQHDMGGYGAPPPQQATGGYGAPPQQTQSGYGAPAPGQGGYGPPSHAPPAGYGPPSQGGAGGQYGSSSHQGYGAPPQQQQQQQQPSMGYGPRGNGAGYGTQQQTGGYGAAGGAGFKSQGGGGGGPLRNTQPARAAPYSVGQRGQMAPVGGAGVKAPVQRMNHGAGQYGGMAPSTPSGFRY